MKIFFLINIALKFLPQGLIDNNPALVKIKPVPEPMLTQFNDVYMGKGGGGGGGGGGK